MPAHAAPSAAEADSGADSATPAFSGAVCGGVGEAAGFLGLDWVRRGMQQALGFDPWPGTLNLRMHGSAWQRWRRTLALQPGIRLEPAPGFCAAKCFRVRLNERLDAAAVFPEVDGYPEDKLELVAPLHLRTALGLRDGDRVQLRLLPGA